MAAQEHLFLENSILCLPFCNFVLSYFLVPSLVSLYSHFFSSELITTISFSWIFNTYYYYYFIFWKAKQQSNRKEKELQLPPDARHRWGCARLKPEAQSSIRVCHVICGDPSTWAWLPPRVPINRKLNQRWNLRLLLQAQPQSHFAFSSANVVRRCPKWWLNHWTKRPSLESFFF